MKMNFTEEESFPRGGKKPKIKSASKRPKEDDNVSRKQIIKLKLIFGETIHVSFIAIQYRRCFKS